MNTRLLVIFALLCVATLASATPAKALNCGQLRAWDEQTISTAPSYKVMKSDEAGPSDSGLSLIETSIVNGERVSKVYELESTGEGSADSTHYSVVPANDYVQTVKVQDQLIWAKLIDLDGYSVNDCKR